MERHTRIYLKHFGYTTGDTFIPSELSGKKAGAVHHIHRRGMGGDKSMDRIENLMAVTDEEHDEHGEKVEDKAMLYKKHKAFLIKIGKPFDIEWIDEQIEKYS